MFNNRASNEKEEKMKKTYPYISFTLLLALVLISGIACHLIFPYQTVNLATQKEYLCSAQIYRALDNDTEFTEEWEFYAFPPLQCSISREPCYFDEMCDEGETCKQFPNEYCSEKIEDYVADYMAPNFSWSYRNLIASNIKKNGAVDCEDTAPPKTYGAPFGAEIVWNDPVPATQAYAFVSIKDKDDDNYYSAEPEVANAYADFAERTGLPDWSIGGTYIPGKRNIRFSDLYLELITPFNLGNLEVTKFYIQSIGSVIGEADTTGNLYTVYPGNAKFFLYAQGKKSGKTGTTSLCFVNDVKANVTVYQGPPYAFFALSLVLPLDIGDVGNLLVKLSLSKPTASPSFKTHQPFVALWDKNLTSPLTLETDIFFDHDDNLDTYLWFENFEDVNNEKFLGEGNPLPNVSFKDPGEHDITVVAYDSYGAYNSASMTLTVNIAPEAADDVYSVKEDDVLIVNAPGVLGNDNDVDSLTAIKVSDPTSGTLKFNSDGSFTYKPNENWFGADSFTYKANDGTEDSNIATVKINVHEVKNQDEVKNIIDDVKDLFDAGTLNLGQANSCEKLLNKIIDAIDQGNTKKACNLLKAFINHVKGLIADGVLNQTDGQSLINAANNLRAEINC
jgi:hypothetical protein